MGSFGDDWERFSSRHVGEWHIRALAISVSDGSLLSSGSFVITSQPPKRSRINPSSLLLKWNVRDAGSETALRGESELLLRYNLDKLHVFADGSYSADHTLVELDWILPPAYAIAQHAIEFALPVSATERVRAFLVYDERRVLRCLLLLEEARSGLFDTREPLSLTSMTGEWRGVSQTFRYDDEDQPGNGFGAPKRPSPSGRSRRVYDTEDLPPQLKNPSGGDDGLLKTKTVVQFGWDPTKDTVRRATMISDMQDHELGRSVIYGDIDSNDVGLFDIARFESNSPNESVFAVLNNACFIMAPVKRVRGVPSTAELGCHVTPGFRRRIVRVYGKRTVTSETLTSESLS